MDSLQYEDSSQFVGSLMRDSFAMDANQPNYPPFQPRGPKPSEEWASASSKLTDGGSKEVVSVFDADGDGPPASLYADGSKGDGGITFSKFVSPGDGGGFMSPSASIDAPFTLDDSPVHSTLHAPRGPRPSDNADLVPSSTITSASSSLLADGGPAPGESTPSSNQASKPARVPRPRKEDKQPDPRDAYREWYAGYMSAAQGGDEGVESQTMPQQQKRREKGAKRVNPETRKHILESVVRSPLARVTSDAGKIVRERELTTVLRLQHSRSAGDDRVVKTLIKSPYVGVRGSFTADNSGGSSQRRPLPSRHIVDTYDGTDDGVAVDDGEVDEYFFTEANAAELELFGKTMDVLAYARQPLPEARMPTQGSPIRRRERTGTHKTVGGGLEGEEEERKGDADTAIDVGASGVKGATVSREHGATQRPTSISSSTHVDTHKPRAVAIAEAEIEWEETVASNVLQLFRSDLSRRALADPRKTGNFYFTPGMIGATNPLGQPTPVPKLPPVIPQRPVKTTTSNRAGTLTTFGVPTQLPQLAASGSLADYGITLGETTTPADVQIAQTLAVVVERVDLAVEQSTSVLGVPSDRKGVAMNTIAGGAGNAPGAAKLRDGPYSIWFMHDSGAVAGKSLWCGLAVLAAGSGYGGLPLESLEEAIGSAIGSAPSTAVCSHALCGYLAKLELCEMYEEFVNLVSAVMLPRILELPHTDIDSMQWRQLIVVTSVFASRATDHRRYPQALSLIRKAEHLMDQDLDMTSGVKKELTAFVSDAYAYYLMRRNQLQSALDCARKASKIHIALGQHNQLAKTRLHTATILSKQRKHVEALKYVEQVLKMLDDGLLELEGVNSVMLSLVAVAYHNQAVELVLAPSQRAQESCVAMQSCRRIAKLCASDCGVYQEYFDLTQHAVLRALNATPEVRALMVGLTPAAVLKKLTEDLFSESTA